ncbi:hypothetical protein SAMN05216226_110151 [Halovenus aranensis]|uniref:DUF5658 domain-containing protein n=1 Tax=Halovenus aranensis TaxID=890420 RepID=A0A1G8X7T5_9EURY|nr:hypothetical protein [Halovenus aranensis]SDJ86573.1 hypothetical protein SAMN05216226_110151 [Halovenus aranensis]
MIDCRKTTWAWVIAVAAFFAGDTATTVIAVDVGLYETYPVVRHIIESSPSMVVAASVTVAMKIPIVAAIAALNAVLVNRRYRVVAPVVLGALGAAVSVSNAVQIVSLA